MEAIAMTRRAIVTACLWLAACFRAHPDGQQELAGQDCYTCHVNDYNTTTAPSHGAMPAVYSTNCASCHQMSAWRPALDGAHSDLFVIASGPHAQIPCQGCHELASALPSKLGANTNCLQCHPDDAPLTASHVGVTLFAGSPYSYDSSVPNFCLQCHPTGLGELHPDKLFARKSDHAVVCSACHDRAVGPDDKGANVTCVDAACHHTLRETDGTDGHKDGDYQKSRGNGSDRAFCHECHS
jgi:hypothetical protein